MYLQASHKDLIGIIEFCIEPRPQRADRVFHFYHPERTFLKKTITLDTQHPLWLYGGGSALGAEEDNVFVCSSDPEVTSEIRSVVCIAITIRT